MQAIDIKLLTGNWRAKNRLHRVGGVGVGGFFGEETAKLGRGNGRGWRDGIRVEDEFLVMAGSLFPIDRIYQQAVIIRKNPAEKYRLA